MYSSSIRAHVSFERRFDRTTMRDGLAAVVLAEADERGADFGSDVSIPPV
jgi:hypothetical protein